MSILEAMSYRMAIVTTPVGGIPSLINDKVNGLLFKPGDKEGLFSAIDLLVNKDIKLKDNTDVVEKYFPCRVADKLTRIYQSLL